MKNKIINDPIHGFITLPAGPILEVINHPYFQRLRRIKQLGLTEYVYPGAHHTRFHHAIGAMHLMGIALDTLKSKGHSISEEEECAGMIAVLCHDIGHGPFSHALEYSFVADISHETISEMLLTRLATELGGVVKIALEIFKNEYPRKFFHQLMSSQLDVDRLDYLKRDSFFTGVIEGGVGSSRILRMLDLVNDEIVVEEKAIYSVEHFLSARRLMYWQVYLHKAVLATEQMLVQIINRAQWLAGKNYQIAAPEHLLVFLSEKISTGHFLSNPSLLDKYLLLDDYDLWTCIKQWMSHPDKVLSDLCKALLNRKLFKAYLSQEPFHQKEEEVLLNKIVDRMGVSEEDAKFYILSGTVTNSAYLSTDKSIKILMKTGDLVDIAQASDLPNIQAMSNVVTKYYLCHHKSISIH